MVKKVAIVSLSRGILGESYVQHEYDIGMKRLKALGLEVKIMDSALKGVDYVQMHPEERAKDLINAFHDDSIDMILCAIGGNDTYRLLPYLFAHDELKKAVKEKIFLGFSDSTINHFMLHKVGLKTFYGQAFLPDVAELDTEMLPYSKFYFERLLKNGKIEEIVPSKIWYGERTNFDPSQIGVPRVSYANSGFELLQGEGVFTGKILGGCIDTIYDIFNSERYEDTVVLCERYNIFPSTEEWGGRILLIETSEERPTPDKYEKMLMAIKETGIFNVVNGVLVGRPIDETYYESYKEILIKVIDNPNLSILYNINVGHATPRCIIPFGVEAKVDSYNQKITFHY